MAKRTKPYKCFLVEETAPFRRIPMGIYDGLTATFAQRKAERRNATMMRNLECGNYHIEASEQPEVA
jgi:hypothetical protein